MTLFKFNVIGTAIVLATSAVALYLGTTPLAYLVLTVPMYYVGVWRGHLEEQWRRKQ